jgi:hypothetical protein
VIAPPNSPPVHESATATVFPEADNASPSNLAAEEVSRSAK